MRDLLLEILPILNVLALLAALLVILYVFLVVRALYTHLKELGVAPELLPKKKRERRNPVTRARDYLKRGDKGAHA